MCVNDINDRSHFSAPPFPADALLLAPGTSSVSSTSIIVSPSTSTIIPSIPSARSFGTTSVKDRYRTVGPKYCTTFLACFRFVSSSSNKADCRDSMFLRSVSFASSNISSCDSSRSMIFSFLGIPAFFVLCLSTGTHCASPNRLFYLSFLALL